MTAYIVEIILFIIGVFCAYGLVLIKDTRDQLVELNTGFATMSQWMIDKEKFDKQVYKELDRRLSAVEPKK